jgi:hypothetical protein
MRRKDWVVPEEIRSEVKEELSKTKEYVQQGFEAMNENIGGVEKRLTDKIEVFEDRTFSPDEKESILDTVKLVNDHLADNVVGRTDITLTRLEYDMLMQSVRLPNRFLKPETIEVE